MRTWTDNTGLYSTVARLVVIMDGKVRLLKENGRFTTVSMRRLSKADRGYVEQIAAEMGRGVIAHVAGR
jgi:hypothetical protein